MQNSDSSEGKIDFAGLSDEYKFLKSEIDTRVNAVLNHGRYIMGPEIAELESALADFCGAKHAVSCASGTDALTMIMLAEEVKSGDCVFMPSFTFTATAEVVVLHGLTPVFVDVDPDNYNLDLIDLRAKIAEVKEQGVHRPRAILAADLFGLPCDYKALRAIADEHDMLVWSDAAQSFGASIDNRKVGTLTNITATSFFPAKPLGCYGDGGAVFTNDDDLAEALKSIRMHGKGREKYDIVRIGINSRLDTIQAAVLLAKLPHFADHVSRRNAIARSYDALLSGVVKTPLLHESRTSAWAQYTIQVSPDSRDALADSLREKGIPTAVYYPRPMHLQTAYTRFGKGPGSLPVSEALSQSVLSLPMNPYLTDEQVDRIGNAIRAWVKPALSV